jgi:hypothetical protein
VGASEPLTESGEAFLENKPRRGFFSSVEDIVRWDGRLVGGRRRACLGTGMLYSSH